MNYVNHVDMMKKFIERNLSKGVNTFTHKDIIEVTNANCPYSVLRSLKKYYEIEFKDEKRATQKQDLEGNLKYVDIKFRQYTVVKRKEQNVKKPSFRGEGKAYQLPLIFLGERTS